ncbi:mammalian cell entry protein [Mycolicibacterium peregrinum]|jgi:Mce-associated membrane protein|uniref:Mammalian cell entry protein n=1 Tax=Mycolicibacterium peregrinum TaxID=43304 RepID=A0A4Z0HPC4_MYCPR|nr:mammalian cell entry protein [Mycolicibacterium peregrinum]TGB38187.1 mammalian cell entry protein [Mycolicibacterium peregrinum]TGB38284.1 mammalian cell entry protein [Mycolicibacterium peregrinum]
MRSKLTALLIGLLTVAFVGLAAVGGSLYWNRVAQRGQETARAELPALAAEQIPKVFGYDYQTVERSLMETYPLLAPDFRQQFEKDATAKVIPEARKRQLVVQISVVGIGVMTAQRDSGSVMVYMNRTVTDQSRQPLYDGSRLKVDYRKIGGDWLINAINPI